MANQNVTQLTQQTVSAAPSSLFYAVTGGSTDTGLPLSVLVNNLGLTGVPTVPTAAVNTNSVQIASCAYVINQGYLTTATAAATYAPIASPTFTGTVVIPTVILSGGTINSTSVGATTPSTGNFTTLNTTGLATLNSVSCSSATLSGGTINGMTVGATTANTGAFTTLSATSTVSGAGFTSLFASPPAIGGTAAAAGKFTTLQATSTITPSTTSGIVGTTLADSANAGSVGEIISSSIVVGSQVALTNNTAANVTSISLTAGDWDVWGQVVFNAAGTTTTLSIVAWINTVTAAQPTYSNPATSGQLITTANAAAGQAFVLSAGTARINVSTTTTVFLGAQSAFGVSTMGAYGYIQARRRR